MGGFIQGVQNGLSWAWDGITHPMDAISAAEARSHGFNSVEAYKKWQAKQPGNGNYYGTGNPAIDSVLNAVGGVGVGVNAGFSGNGGFEGNGSVGSLSPHIGSTDPNTPIPTGNNERFGKMTADRDNGSYNNGDSSILGIQFSGRSPSDESSLFGMRVPASSNFGYNPEINTQVQNALNSYWADVANNQTNINTNSQAIAPPGSFVNGRPALNDTEYTPGQSPNSPLSIPPSNNIGMTAINLGNPMERLKWDGTRLIDTAPSNKLGTTDINLINPSIAAGPTKLGVSPVMAEHAVNLPDRMYDLSTPEGRAYQNYISAGVDPDTARQKTKALYPTPDGNPIDMSKPTPGNNGGFKPDPNLLQTVVGIGSAVAPVVSGNIQAQGQMDAADKLLEFQREALAEQKRQFDQQQLNIAPWLEKGSHALTDLEKFNDNWKPFTFNWNPVNVDRNVNSAGSKYNLNDMLAPANGFNDPADSNIDPSYAFRFEEGRKALENSAAARGGLLSGNTGKALTNYGQQAASQEYQNAFNRYQTERGARLNSLQSMAGLGQTAVNQANNSSQNYASAYGNAQGTMGNAMAQGITGAANANASGLMGAVNGATNSLSAWLQNQNQQAYLDLLKARNT